MLHRLENQLRKSRIDCMRRRKISWRRKSDQKEMKIPHQEPQRHHHRLEHYRKELNIPHQEPERHHQGLEHDHKELEISHQEPHLLFHSGTQRLPRSGSNLLLRLRLHQMHRITSPAVLDPIDASKKRSTTPRQGSIGGRPPGHVCSFRTIVETYFGSRRKKTG